jgi:hypothetical protein
MKNTTQMPTFNLKAYKVWVKNKAQIANDYLVLFHFWQDMARNYSQGEEKKQAQQNAIDYSYLHSQAIEQAKEWNLMYNDLINRQN